MKTENLPFPPGQAASEFFRPRATNLVFDDDDLERILYGREGRPATPVDVIEASRGCRDLPAAWRQTLVQILVRSPERGRFLTEETLALLVEQEAATLAASEAVSPQQVLSLARLYQAASRVAEAEATYRRVLAMPSGSAEPEGGLTGAERAQATEQLMKLVEARGGGAEVTELGYLYQAEQILAHPRGELVQVRSLALELFMAGQPRAAERLYRELLEQDFEVPGTLVHLNRILLVQDRYTEGRQALAQAQRQVRNPAWREKTPLYVQLRILFLRILYAMLAGRPYATLAGRLIRLLVEYPEQMPWTILPVIDHLAHHLDSEELELLKAIAAAINDAQALERLLGLAPA